MKEKLDCTAIILAGGKSTRLGYDKAFTVLNKQSLIEGTLDCLSQISRTILVVISQDQLDLIKSAGLKSKIVVDIYPGGGPLGGIYTGLINSTTDYNLVVGCDMPFLNIALLRYLFGLSPSYDAVVPKIDKNIEPLHAIYSKNCISYIELLLTENKLQISRLFNSVKTRYVTIDEIVKYDPKCISIFNVNTQADLIEAKRLSKQRYIQ